ncbi:MAG: T9SS type A sorting domain-containing protein [Bacteroidetes bacterium]|nr:T9SS type A sorting domain-containing protein [Bacteroidota bacterium]MBL6943215.1 T9SS type A sorting domain-containing protein [Bacteroidales bacterium]
MKKSHLLLFTFVLIGFKCFAQWEPQNSGTTKRLKDVFFTNVDTGYAVGNNDTGDGGIILKTTNGGIDWITLMIADTLEFNSVYFTDANTGYVAGSKQYWSNPAIILKTTNGGISWSIVFNYSYSNESGASLVSVYFPGPNTGYAVGNIMYTSMGTSPFIIKTSNGGANWTINDSIPGDKLSSIFFTSIDTGYAVGDNKVLRTTNGGTNWEVQTLSVVNMKDVFFANANTGYIIGSMHEGYSVELKTIDAGISWSPLNIGGMFPPLPFLSIYFTDANTGYFVNDEIFKTLNGGGSWMNQYMGEYSYTSVFFPVPDTGYIVGSNGTILKTINGGITRIGKKEKSNKLFSFYPNPANDNITISSTSLTGITQLLIFNVSGEKVIERQLTNIETQISVSALPGGVYFVRLQNEKMVEIGKIVKE